jgi:hypothetical protein
MPMTGTDHVLMIEKLRKRGICKEADTANTHKVADKIWEELNSVVRGWTHQTVTSISNRAALQEPLQIPPSRVSSERDNPVPSEFVRGLGRWKNTNHRV